MKQYTTPVLEIKQRISDIKKRLQATTPGVWKIWKPEEDYLGDDDPCIETEDGVYVAQTSYDGLSNTCRPTMYADAEFIAHAKEDICFLLTQLEIQFGE